MVPRGRQSLGVDSPIRDLLSGLTSPFPRQMDPADGYPGAAQSDCDSVLLIIIGYESDAPGGG